MVNEDDTFNLVIVVVAEQTDGKMPSGNNVKKRYNKYIDTQLLFIHLLFVTLCILLSPPDGSTPLGYSIPLTSRFFSNGILVSNFTTDLELIIPGSFSSSLSFYSFVVQLDICIDILLVTEGMPFEWQFHLECDNGISARSMTWLDGIQTANHCKL